MRRRFVTEETKPLNIFQRLNEVRKRVSYLQKDKQVGSGGWGYKAITHDAVTAAVREHLIEFGVLVVPNLIEGNVILTGTQTGKGIPIIRYEALYEVNFVASDTGDALVMKVAAHALDEGDKAPGKALSYATKYAMLKLFSIETGEEEEERITQKRKYSDDPGQQLAEKIIDANVKPLAGAMEDLEPDMQILVQDIATEVGSLMNKQDTAGAVERIEVSQLDAESMKALWSLLDSKHRSAIKKFKEAAKEKV